MFQEDLVNQKTAEKKSIDTIIDYFFLGDSNNHKTEQKLTKYRDELIADIYHERGILNGEREENINLIKTDFESRKDYLSVLIFERNKDWSIINPKATVSFFFDENNLPSFKNMPKESIQKLKETLIEDTQRINIENNYNINEPKIAEIGRFAIKKNTSLKTLYSILGHSYLISNFLSSDFGKEKTHYVLCCNCKHSERYKNIFKFINIKDSIAPVYNNKEGMFSYIRVNDAISSPFSNKAREYKPSIISY